MEAIELKIKRIRLGIKQYELAARLGISATQLCEIELGRRQPSPEMRERILRVIQEHGSESSAEKGQDQ